MSKHFGGGGGGGSGRRLDGHGHNSKDYPPRRSGGVEDKRPSVFERLGVRKYDDNLQTSHSHSSHSHYGGSGSGESYRRDAPGGLRKHSPLQGPVMSSRRSQPDVRERIRSRSRSRSFSPRSRKVPHEMTHHHGHGHMGGHQGHGHSHGHGLPSMKKSKIKDISPHDHRMRQRSNSPTMRRKPDKSVGMSNNSPKWRDDNPPMGRHKVPGGGGGPSGKTKKGSGKRSGKKSGKERKSGVGLKGRSTSRSSGSSGETSSSSRSASSSSTTSEASSSTSSNATSSSDSSVPSIKLRHDKQKRKKTKRPSSKSESVSTGQIQSQSRVSSGSSIESGNVRDNRDLREKIKAKTRQNYERMQDGTPPEIRQQRRQPPPDQYGSGGSRSFSKQDLRDESPGSSRRRRSSGTPSFDEKPHKRRRILSPEEFVPSPRRAPPPNEITSSASHQLRRDRSPLPRDRIRVIQSPMRRAPAEDGRRNDMRGDMTKRLDNYGDKPRDMDRYRDETYGRDNMNRQKERLAPARSTSISGRHSSSHPMTPDRDRDRGLMERPGPPPTAPGSAYRFEARNHTRPLLQLPSGVTPEPQKSVSYNRQEERVVRTVLQPQSSPTTPKHSPLIVKSKEALIEKYRVMKQSQYVDMWVDKTVQACAPPASNIVSPPKDPPSASSKPADESGDAGTKATGMKDMEDLLSDFSDDADELLNDVGDDAKSEKSEKENSVVDKNKSAVNTGGDGEAEVASTTETPTTAAVTDVIKKTVPPATAPTTIVSTLAVPERKSLGTPQRSFTDGGREGQSLPSRSQTEDDILERMDFEEISDEELGDVGGDKIPIVDALGVDWASLVCGEKNRSASPCSVLSAASTSMMKVRKRWHALQLFRQVGLLSNCSEKILQKIVKQKMKEEQPFSDGASSATDDTMELEEKIQEEFQNASKLRKVRARANVIDTIGLGPNSRALSCRRDMALRRYYLGMPQKSLVLLSALQTGPPSNPIQDLESIGELYRLSLSLFKGSESAAVAL